MSGVDGPKVLGSDGIVNTLHGSDKEIAILNQFALRVDQDIASLQTKQAQLEKKLNDFVYSQHNGEKSVESTPNIKTNSVSEEISRIEFERLMKQHGCSKVEIKMNLDVYDRDPSFAQRWKQYYSTKRNCLVQ